MPGAGTYDPAPPKEETDGPSSAFASGVQRFTKSAPTRVSAAKPSRPKDAVPPPWHYHPRTMNVWDGGVKQNDTFGSTVERFPRNELGGGVRVHRTPGPGQYAPKHPSDGFRKQQSTVMCFGSKEARFGGRQGILSGAMPTPGPGQYDAGVEHNNPLIRRSFNITIG